MAFSILIILSFSYKMVNDSKQSSSIILQFVTTNGFGNNLYLDNISFQKRDTVISTDIALIAINNIKKDTTFLPGIPFLKFNPVVSVANIGKISPVDSIGIVLTIGRYQVYDTARVFLPVGQAANVTFPEITVFPNRPLDIVVYLLGNTILGDTNHYNDTLRQNSVYLNGIVRNVLFEEFTSTTSPSCAANNPSLDNFININFSSICAVKYHVGFPFPGNDSLYLPDTAQLIQRVNYYFVNAVPNLLADGVFKMPLPYTFLPNLDTTYSKRALIGSPVSINVTDTRLTGDTIQSVININNLYNLPAGDYRLRVMAIERFKNYPNAPGLNGETQFFDIFRQAFPDSAGFIINPLAGNYSYTVKYLRKPDWIDSMTYTLAFVQNDKTREVINCAKARQIPLMDKMILNNSNHKIFYRPDINKYAKFIYNTYYEKQNYDTGITPTNIELFEEPFPPAGWILKNPDRGPTFEQILGVNGISFGGSACTGLLFYNYSNIGQKDTLISRTFNNILPTDTLKFDYAYAQYLSDFADTLTVSLSTDGGASFVKIFEAGGTVLATAGASTLPFVPISATDWKTYAYPMSAILPSSLNETDVTDYRLFPNYPNPFNPKTTIKYQVPNLCFVTIKIYDITGREITKLVNQNQTKGIYTVQFDGSGFASGIYFCQMVAGKFVKVLKLALVK